MEWFICKKVWSCRMVSVKMVLWNIKQNNIRTIEFKKHVEESHSWQIPGKCYLWFSDSGGNRKGILAWTGLIIISNLHLSHLTTAWKRPHTLGIIDLIIFNSVYQKLCILQLKMSTVISKLLHKVLYCAVLLWEYLINITNTNIFRAINNTDKKH